MLVILAQSAKGWNIIDNALLNGGNNGIVEVLYVFEMVLCFDAWINRTEYWLSTENNFYIDSSKKSIRMMMNNIKRLLPNTSQSQGWENPKFHLLLHFVDMTERFGSPKNYD